ncbi:MAG: ATP-dependent DNA ligase [Burkholderiales bacterium]
MRRFADLYCALDASTKTNAKVAALAAYFREAPPADAAWATYFLTGRKLVRTVGSRDLRGAALALSGLPEWLFEASYDAVGDLAETIALVLPPATGNDERGLAPWVEEELAPLAGLPPAEVQARLAACWERLDRDGRFVFTKLATGAFRVGVARQLVLRGLAEAYDVPVADVAQRLIADWRPNAEFRSLVRGEHAAGSTPTHRPYPFLLAHPLDREPAVLGPIADWQAEWKWDGIRAQLLVREDGVSLWSRGEELVNDAFPEVLAAARELPPGTALDGEILAWRAEDEAPLPFAELQRRLNRKTPGAKLMREVPVTLVAYDLLEAGGADVRGEALAVRRGRLAELLPAGPVLRLSPLVEAADWDALAHLRSGARERRAEGLMLKARASPYGIGRVRGAWWKWKLDPYTVDAVLVYAQAGHGRRASLYTDYTFAVWDGEELVPFAKAYSGLTDAEIREVDAWVRAHTIERFGPVRRVEPVLVFEVAFEGIRASPRHRSGVAVRFPRIARWRRDKPPAECDSLNGLRSLLRADRPDKEA